MFKIGMMAKTQLCPKLWAIFRGISSKWKIILFSQICRNFFVDAFRIKNRSISICLDKVMPNSLPKGQICQNSIFLKQKKFEFWKLLKWMSFSLTFCMNLVDMLKFPKSHNSSILSKDWVCSELHNLDHKNSLWIWPN